MTATDILRQLTELLYMVVFGCIFFFVFDGINAISRQVKWGRHVKVVADFSFAMMAAILFCVLLIKQHDGVMRNYIVIGVVLGVGIYVLLFRRFCQPVCNWIAWIILWLCRWILRIVLMPWRIWKRCFLGPLYRKITKKITKYKTARAEQLQAEYNTENSVEDFV